jgi:hypothetical protein
MGFVYPVSGTKSRNDLQKNNLDQARLVELDRARGKRGELGRGCLVADGFRARALSPSSSHRFAKPTDSKGSLSNVIVTTPRIRKSAIVPPRQGRPGVWP